MMTFSSYFLTTALRLEPDVIQQTSHGQRCFECVHGRWFQQAWVEGFGLCRQNEGKALWKKIK
ncbi:MAG TPA: hypothetical protein VK058_00130 [Paenalcaligenes sp.]|nr:hypothetical protein [Paenalcaligenes sp.]